MPRKRTTGLNKVIRRNPDGSIKRVDYYHRRSGLLLGNDLATALVLAAKMDEEAETGGGPAPGSFEAVARGWLASPTFAAKAPRTRTLDRAYLDQLRDRFGALPVQAITRPVVIKLRDKLAAATPVKARHTLSVLRQVMQYAVDTGLILHNPALRPGLPARPPRKAVWPPAAIETFLSVAEPAMRRAFLLMLYTAQRVSDVLALDWSQFERRGRRIVLTLRQAKTGELVAVPAAARLETELRASWRESGPVVPAPRGGPWNRRNFTRAWAATVCRANRRIAREGFRAGLDKAGVHKTLIRGLQARDLRRTAIVAMARAGATTAQIAAVSGHRIEECQKILDTYLPRRFDVAHGAIAALDRAEKDMQRLSNRAVRPGTRIPEKLREKLVGAAGFEPTTPSPPD
ncbi:tyrosine-type recombinase/integrase [Elioraea sp.]|uniref:tyrosine-type recombinase/integrase n=1 Tax=Elioraea sp. TaxID=2185103 RepID=UPI003F6FCCB2